MLRQLTRASRLIADFPRSISVCALSCQHVTAGDFSAVEGPNSHRRQVSKMVEPTNSQPPMFTALKEKDEMTRQRGFSIDHAFSTTAGPEQVVPDNEAGMPPRSPEEVSPDRTAPSAQETPQEAAHAYWALAGMHASIAAPHFIFPEEVALVLFNPAAALPVDPIQIELIRMLGTGYVAASVSLLALKAGADRRELHKNVYRRLNMGVVTFATAAIAAEVVHLDVLDIAASIGMGTILGITVAIPSYYYAMTSGHGLGLWSIMKGAVRDLDVLGRVKTGKGVAYALLAPAFYGGGLACTLTPAESLTNVFQYAHGEDCITLWRMFGASLLMLPTWAVSLKEAADRRHLDRPPYITLHMGLALTGLINVAILSPWWTQYSAGPVMPLMLGTWATAAAVGIWGELTPTSADPITQP